MEENMVCVCVEPSSINSAFDGCHPLHSIPQLLRFKYSSPSTLPQLTNLSGLKDVMQIRSVPLQQRVPSSYVPTWVNGTQSAWVTPTLCVVYGYLIFQGWSLASFLGLPTVQFLIAWRGKDRSILSCELTSVSTLVDKSWEGSLIEKTSFEALSCSFCPECWRSVEHLWSVKHTAACSNNKSSFVCANI